MLHRRTVVTIFYFGVLLLTPACKVMKMPNGIEASPVSVQVKGSDVNTVNQLPYFLGEVWPGPGEVIEMARYRDWIATTGYRYHGVGVEIVLPMRVETRDSQITPNAFLYIDGKQISTEGTPVYVGGEVGEVQVVDSLTGEILDEYLEDRGPYWINWPVELEIGNHMAIIIIAGQDHTDHMYSWQFTITNE